MALTVLAKVFVESPLFLWAEPCAGVISKRSTRAGRSASKAATPKTAPLHQKPGPQPPATAPRTEAYEKTAHTAEKRTCAAPHNNYLLSREAK